MKKPIIHFAHANGFPAKTYNKIFSFLKDDFEAGYLERHAHNPKFAVENNWESLKEELRIEIEKHYVVLLDAMVISRLSSFVIKWFRNTQLFEKNSQALATVVRRNHFETREDIFEHYLRKEKFAKFDKDVLQDYVKYGFVENKDGYELFIEPQIEAEIYKTIPDNLPSLKGKIKIPTIYIGGSNSYEAKLAQIGFMKRNFPFEFTKINGTHLFPFESPMQTAQIIKNFLLI